MLFEFECPRCNGSSCEIHSEESTDPIIRKGFHHFAHSPGLAINELIFGQRLPKVYLVCKSCPSSYNDRSYVHCPHCDVFHSGNIFDTFGNWHGLVCPDCGGTIPAIENTTATALRKATSPLSKLIQQSANNSYVERKRLSQSSRRQQLAPSSENTQKPNYALAGFLFGSCMFLVSMIFVGGAAVMLQFEMETILWGTALVLALNIAGGAYFGFAMHSRLEKKGNPESHLNVRKMLEEKEPLE